jgi:hypothetical protein
LRHDHHSSQLAFNDMLFNILIGFVVLFILAFMLINPITKKNDIPVKAEVMVILEWEDSSEDDIDLWISGPGMQEPLSFQRKQSGMMHLDRDDLGASTDVAIVDNITIKLKYNREIATMRGILAGEYYINVHVYSKRDQQPTKFKITLMDVNPFQELYVLDGTSDETGQVIKFPAFIIDDSGKITKLFNSEQIVVRVMQQQATGASVR